MKEEPLPADAPPLPEQSQSEHIALENEGGKELILKSFCLLKIITFLSFTVKNALKAHFNAVLKYICKIPSDILVY